MIKLIEDRLSEITALCKEHRVKSIALFGSAARDTMTAERDIDFLVQFSEEIDSCKVDLYAA